MYCCRAVCSLAQKQRIGLCTRTTDRSFKLSSSLPPNLSKYGYLNKCNVVWNLCQKGEKAVNYKNYCTRGADRSSKEGRNQDEEKRKSYILYGTIAAISVFIFATLIVLLNQSYDHVYIQPPLREKK